MEGAVLAAKNDDADAINCSVIRRFPGDIYDMKSADSVSMHGEENAYPVEFLNSLDISGLPPPRPSIEDRDTRNDPEES